MVSATGENLVFLLSTPRSGSTLLGAILGNHPLIACPPEPWFLLRLASVYAAATDRGWYDDELAARATREFLPDQTFLAGARAFATTAYNSHLQQVGRQIFIDKTPRYYHVLPFLNAAFPQARFIWLQRNPLAVAASFRRTWAIGTDVLTGARLTPHTFDLAFALRRLMRGFSAPSPLHIEVQFEQLVRQPDVEIRRLCAFLEVTVTDDMLSYRNNAALMQAYSESSVGDRTLLEHDRPVADPVDRWREILSAQEVGQIVALVGRDVFSRMGYSDDLPASTASHDVKEAVPLGEHFAAMLRDDVSPADPLTPYDGVDPAPALRSMQHDAIVSALAQSQAAEREMKDSRDAYRTAYETLAARDQRRVQLRNRFARPLWRRLLQSWRRRDPPLPTGEG